MSLPLGCSGYTAQGTVKDFILEQKLNIEKKQNFLRIFSDSSVCSDKPSGQLT